jgi:hypothetical protein
MRALIGFTVLTVGLTGTLAGPAPSSTLGPVGTFAAAPEPAVRERPMQKSDRIQLASVDVGAIDLGLRRGEPAIVETPAQLPEETPAQSELPATGLDESIKALKAEPALAPEVSHEELCQTIMSSAQASDLPIAFFSNLIWQESRFRTTAVSPVGAQGVAQFMPATAAAYALTNPFDPSAALPASARLLRELRLQFGNLGLAAAAYNAGPKRVLDWLAKKRKLPQETQNYVLTITGRPAERWRGQELRMATFKLSSRLPCRRLPDFADLDSAATAIQTATPDKAPQVKLVQSARAEIRKQARRTRLANTKMPQLAKVASLVAETNKGKTAKTTKPVKITAVARETARAAKGSQKGQSSTRKNQKTAKVRVASGK